ncbi:MAG: TIR domain-containing protein, partial [Anaerolinea sp.]|nr:TIR domain-containing protein [Anaerolinea sp.]
MTHLFVSHATTDDLVVSTRHDRLEAAGIPAWVDHEDILPGMDWETEIQTALTACNAGLYILSPRSANRNEIRPELRTILALDKRLYVALIEPVPREQFPYRLRTIQYADLSKDFEAGLSALIAAIKGERPLDPAAPTTLTEFHLTGSIDPRLTRIEMSGRDADLARVTGLLSQGVTSVLGVGGLGKSRLAAEVVLKDEWADGAVWHVCSEFSTAEEALALLREHCALPVTASRRDVLVAVHGRKLIVVLDNAESVEPGTRQADYVKLANDLHQAGARVLITGRVEWAGIVMGREFHPQTLERDAAREVVVNMGKAFGIEIDLTPHAERLATAAKQHPRLIEFAVGKLKRFPVEKVIRELEAFKSADVQAALDGMIRQTVRQMVEQHGAESETALKRLNTCRGGFTYFAAGVILGLVEGAQPSDQPTLSQRLGAMLDLLANATLDEDTLDERLNALQTWQFVTFREGRYSINPLVVAAVGEDESARQPHYDYYFALARGHRERQDYAGLDVESDNLTAAFEWALNKDAESALWLANECDNFLVNRGRFRQYIYGMLRVTAALVNHPDELRANAQNSLGIAYLNLAGVEDRAGNLRRAIAAYEDALKYRTPAAAQYDYAMTQNNLGTAYANLAGVEDRAGNLRRAIAAFEEALKYRTPATAPLDYAATQNNLAVAYRNLSEIEDRAGNLHRAIAAYEEALNYRTPAAAPLAYAMTQNNLGAAYRNLAAVEDRAENLRRAIAAYEAALQFYTSDAAPLAYATTQNNLGLVYADLAQVEDAEDRAENLYRATSAYDEALKYRTPTSAPLDYARTQGNLGNALEDSGDLAGALACWREAEIYYRRMDMIADADMLRDAIADAEA